MYIWKRLVDMKVALVHDWLTGMRGGEKCLEVFLKMYPEADVYTLMHVPGVTSPRIDERVRGVSFLQRFPGVKRYYRLLLPLFPRAIERFNFSSYDLVISLSHAAAKNVRVSGSAIHVCYCFTPMRYVWDQTYHYLGKLTPLAWPLVRYLRAWDKEGSSSVDRFVAISRFVAARIRCFYGRTCDVVYPPVENCWLNPLTERSKGVAFLYAGALVPYKKPDIAVEAFNQTGLPLWIAGRGPMERYLRRIAKPNVKFFGYVGDRDLSDLYRRCRALIFPGTEDFGLVPVECMASGRPVIGLFSGALKETLNGIKPWNNSHLDASRATGVFIRKTEREEVRSLRASLDLFLALEEEFDPAVCVAWSRQFESGRFIEEWSSLIGSPPAAKAATARGNG